MYFYIGVNNVTVAQAFNSAIQNIWPEGVLYDHVKLLVTDGASYMVKCAAALCTLYPRLLHITCLAHAFHRLCEVVRENYPDLDSLIANVKKVFVKARERVRAFQDTAPGVPIPPEPIITRWGTWLRAAMYYNDHLATVELVLGALDPEEAGAIENAQITASLPTLKLQLGAIAPNYSAIV